MLRFLGRFLVALLLAAALAFAAARGWLWYEAQRGMERLAELARPWAELDWEGVDTGVAGSIEITGLTITPQALEDSIYVEQLVLRADGARDLHSLARRLDSGDPPDALTLSAQDVTVNVGAPVYRRLNAIAGGRLWGTPLDGLACGGAGDMRSVVLDALDERFLAADVELRLRLHRPSARLALLLDVTLPELGASTVDASLELGAGAVAQTGRIDPAALTPSLSTLRLRYTDLGFNEARNYTCAARRDQPVEAFVDAHVAAVGAHLGLDPDEAAAAEALARYREYAVHGGDLQLDLTPQAGVPLADLPGLPAAELAALFRGRTSLNGRALDLPPAAWLKPAPATAPDDETADVTAAAAPRRFRAVEPRALAEHIGRRARLSTYRGARHEGLIGAADDNDVTLENPLRGGMMRFTVEFGEVRSAEVLLRAD